MHYKKAAELRRGGRELVAWESDYFRRYLEAEEGQAAVEKYPDGGSLRWRGGGKNLRPKRRNIRVAPLVYTGAVRYAAALGEIQKNPAVAAAGL